MMLSLTDYTEVLQIRRELRDLRREWEITKRNYYARKAGFRPDQPRDDHGRWSGGAGTQTTIINNSQTGISTIDSTTDDLLKTLANVIDFLPEGSGPLYGIAVHGVFGNLVRFGNFRGIGIGDVETTYGGDGSYGSLGSIRTDVTLRNDIGDPIAIYDVKTGDATLTSARVEELRDSVGAGPNIPVIELHVRRGVTVNGLRTRGRLFARNSCPLKHQFQEEMLTCVGKYRSELNEAITILRANPNCFATYKAAPQPPKEAQLPPFGAGL